ncbi:1859_t:CDS:2 [Acaulospora morrowiae]|uniref:1859_t:CDS:1 n=1 Tax=Acaulospora morrowiae TaxID=94023 RepID=A0A9N8WLJ9_9GLOM|nr:1859_t:CDS:2 [Acaulospora morrowiae]
MTYSDRLYWITVINTFLMFNVAGFSTNVPVILPSDLPTVEEVRGFNTEELNGFLKRRLNDIDDQTDTLTSQKVRGLTFLKLTRDNLLSIQIPLGPAIEIVELINEIQGGKKPLAVIKEHVLYVRKSYVDLYHIVTNENCNPKTDATVIFKALDDKILYCFEDSNLFVGDFEEFLERLCNPQTWYLVDGTVPSDVLARTVISASSKKELETCRLGVFLEHLLFVRKIPMSRGKQTILSNRNEVKKMSLERVKQALSEIRDFRKLIRCFSENENILNSAITLFIGGLTLSTENNLSHVPLVVFLIKSKKKLEDSRWNDLFLKIQYPGDPSSSRGIMFESHILHLFKLGVKRLN